MDSKFDFQTVILELRFCAACGSGFKVHRHSSTHHCSLICRDFFPQKKGKHPPPGIQETVSVPVRKLDPGTLKGHAAREFKKLTWAGTEGARITRRNRLRNQNQGD